MHLSSITDRDLQRANGEARIAIAHINGRPVISDLYQRAPCKIMLPDDHSRSCREAVFLNSAGGIAGGDRILYSICVGDHAQLTATTQTAERVYRALNLAGQVSTQLEARDSAVLEWLPQETILFDGARLHRRTDLRLHASARVLALDWFVLGRAAHGETIKTVEIQDNWRIMREDRLVWADNFRLHGDIATILRSPALLGGCAAIATIVYASPDAVLKLDAAREIMQTVPCVSAATALAGLLICRFASSSALVLRTGIQHFLREFRAVLGVFSAGLPRMWSC